MNAIFFTPEIGEGGYVSAVDWDCRHFYYNNPYGQVMLFNERDTKRFFEAFKGNFKTYNT